MPEISDADFLFSQSVEHREQALLAPYALSSSASLGRKHPEPMHPYRGPFQRDRDRILHSAAYRRLSAKTQVFTGELGDYHRTRLTHTLEVASIARTLARALRLNEDLVEALALAHDVGHPPFGHAGEDVLNECLAEHGGFSHNRQALRIFEELEQRYPGFSGLNLSTEVLEGQATRINHDTSRERPLLEVQVVEAADSVAYDTHDADDALKLGLLDLEDLLQVPLWKEAARRVRRKFSDLQGKALKRAVLHELIDWQVDELLKQIATQLKQAEINTPEKIRLAPWLAQVGPELDQQKKELERFLFERVYRHPQVLRGRIEAQEQLRELFSFYTRKMELLPESFRKRIPLWGLDRTVGDYLAGMTDRFAQQAYEKLADWEK